MVTDNYWESPVYKQYTGVVPIGGVRTNKETFGRPKTTPAPGINLDDMMPFGTRLKNWFGKTFPNATSTLKGAGSKVAGMADNAAAKTINWVKTPGNLGWNTAKGLQLGGVNVGGIATGLGAIGHGYQTIKGLDALDKAQDSTNDLIADILNSAEANPFDQYDLNQEQLALLRDLKNNGAENYTVGLEDLHLLDALKGAGKGVLYGIPGGVGGMVIGGIGGLLGEGTNAMAEAQQSKNAELQALYDAVMESEQNYRNMLRNRAYASF